MIETELTRLSNATWRHYGTASFDPSHVYRRQNQAHLTGVKPWWGVWASPVNVPGTYTWAAGCTENDFEGHSIHGEDHIDFTLDPSAKIIWLCTVDYFQDYPGIFTDDNVGLGRRFNADVYLEQGWDGIYAAAGSDHTSGPDWDGLYMELYGWDCDSICITNPAIIHPIA